MFRTREEAELQDRERRDRENKWLRKREYVPVKLPRPTKQSTQMQVQNWFLNELMDANCQITFEDASESIGHIPYSGAD